MKKAKLSSILSFYALILLFSTTLSNCYVEATVEWEDDFNDGIPDGWTIHSGNVSVEDNMLNFHQSSVEYPDDGWCNIISHESSNIIGTWSFDFRFYSEVDNIHTPRKFEFQFIAPGTDFWDQSCYSFGVFRSATTGIDSFYLYKWVDGARDSEKTKAFVPVSFSGWTHIDISRNSTGHMNVYINGTLRLRTQDTDFETSSNFVIYTAKPLTDDLYLSVDNITVDDEPITTTTPTPTPTDTTTETTTTDTTPPPGIPPELLAIGIGMPVILVIVLLVWKVRK